MGGQLRGMGLLSALRDAVNERTHWVMLSDSNEGHDAMASIAVAIHIASFPTDSELAVGIIGVRSVGIVSVLMIPKRHGSKQSILELLKRNGGVVNVDHLGGEDADPDADLFALTENYEPVIDFVDAVRSGRCFPESELN